MSEFKTLLKYVMTALAATAVDLLLFAGFHVILNTRIGDTSIIVATVIARILSSIVHYMMNSRLVFGQWDKTSLIKFLLLQAAIMCASAVGVYVLSRLLRGIYATFIKMFVDTALFFVNYSVQKLLIFRSEQ